MPQLRLGNWRGGRGACGDGQPTAWRTGLISSAVHSMISCSASYSLRTLPTYPAALAAGGRQLFNSCSSQVVPRVRTVSRARPSTARQPLRRRVRGRPRPRRVLQEPADDLAVPVLAQPPTIRPSHHSVGPTFPSPSNSRDTCSPRNQSRCCQPIGVESSPGSSASPRLRTVPRGAAVRPGRRARRCPARRPDLPRPVSARSVPAGPASWSPPAHHQQVLGASPGRRHVQPAARQLHLGGFGRPVVQTLAGTTARAAPSGTGARSTAGAGRPRTAWPCAARTSRIRLETFCLPSNFVPRPSVIWTRSRGSSDAQFGCRRLPARGQRAERGLLGFGRPARSPAIGLPQVCDMLFCAGLPVRKC